MVFYALLLADPTTEMMICWIDETGNGTDHTIYYGEDKENLNNSQTVSGVEMIEGDGYVYSTSLKELNSDVTYHLEVDTGSFISEIESFKTFPQTLGDKSIKLMTLPDIHINQGYTHNWENPDKIDRFVEENPDIIIIPGDGTGQGDVHERFVSAFKDYFSQFNSEHLTPILWCPGNHEMGGWVDPADNEDDLDERHYPYFVPNLAEIDPVGRGLFYGNIVIGDYLQLVALDSHGVVGEWQDQVNWIKTLTDNANKSFAIHHRGYIHNEGKIYHRSSDVEIPFIDYVTNTTFNEDRKDDKYQVWQREDWFVNLYNGLENLEGFFTGHIHGGAVTRPLKPVEYTPDTPYYLPAGEYNLVRDDEEGVREYGQGFRGIGSSLYHERQLKELLEASIPNSGYSFHIVEIFQEDYEIVNHSYNVNTGERYIIWHKDWEEEIKQELKAVQEKKKLLSIFFD